MVEINTHLDELSRLINAVHYISRCLMHVHFMNFIVKCYHDFSTCIHLFNLRLIIISKMCIQSSNRTVIVLFMMQPIEIIAGRFNANRNDKPNCA